MEQKVTDEILVAYADGELTPEEHAALETRLAADPVLAERARVFLNTGRTALSDLYDDGLNAPVPKHLRALVLDNAQATGVANSVRQWWRRFRTDRPFEAGMATAFGWKHATALSLGLVIGGIAGWTGYGLNQTSHPIGSIGVAAHGDVLTALETQPAGHSLPLDNSGRRDTTFKVLLTFHSRTGEICRQYHLARQKQAQTRSTPSFVGVACRQSGGDWRIMAHVPVSQRTSAADKVTTASHPKNQSVEAVVDDLITGDVLTLEQEAGLINRHWKVAQ